MLATRHDDDDEIYIICKHKSTKLNSYKFTNNSIKQQSFVCTQLNDQTVLFQTIQFSISLS